MTHNVPPLRLTDDPGTSAALRAMVEDAREAVPDASTMAHFSARLEQALLANGPGPAMQLTSSPASGARMVLGWASKASLLAAGLLLGGIGATTAWLGLRGSSTPRSDTPQTLTAAQPTESTSAPGVGAGNAPAESTAVQPPEETRTPGADSRASAGEQRVSGPRHAVEASKDALSASRPTLTQAAPAPAPKVTPSGRVADSAGEELALLQAARSALATDPSKALALTQAHQRKFPKGELREEREVIAIEALQRLGKIDAAKQRGSEFGQQFPNSVHQSKVNQTVKSAVP